MKSEMKIALSAGLASVLMTLTIGCKGSQGSGADDAGGPPVNQCATRDDALNKAQCQLTLGTPVNDYIRSANDQVWYSMRMPSTTNPLSLVHVTAGYGAPNTPVNLGINLLAEGGLGSLGQGADIHGQGAPKLIDLIIRFSDPSARILILVNDLSGLNGRPQFDARNPFTLKAEVVNDPNGARNDVTPSPIPLTNQGGILVGSQSGYLVVANDIHKFSITIDPFVGRRILYIGVSAPAITPPPPYRLAYTLFNPSNLPVSEGHADNEFIAVNLATARLLPGPGTYTLVIQGYHPPDNTDPVLGDLRVRWDITVKELDDLDANEPNDSLATARITNLSSLGARATKVGRLAYIPDQDWFGFDLAASANPTLFHYKLTALSTGGRFPPIPGPVDREVQVFTVVGPSCATDPTVCPQGYGSNQQLQALVQGFCQSNPPQCLQSSRDESFFFPNLRNFEGMLTVPPQAGIRYYVLVQDQGNNWADDMDYQLDVEWLADDAETARYDGGVKQPQVVDIYNDVSGSTYPVPPPAATRLAGRLAYGFGNLVQNDPNRGTGVRGASDYDSALVVDRYQLNFTGAGGPPMDRSWELQWSVDGGGSPGPYDLLLDLQFCDPTVPDGGSCVLVSRTNRNNPLSLAYTPAALNSWHNQGPRQPIYDRAADGTVTARAYGCFCFEPRFVQGGKFYVNVSAVDRNNYIQAPYLISTAFTSYPKTYPVDGGNQSCPAPVLDAGTWYPGCQFAHEP